MPLIGVFLETFESDFFHEVGYWRQKYKVGECRLPKYKIATILQWMKDIYDKADKYNNWGAKYKYQAKLFSIYISIVILQSNYIP